MANQRQFWLPRLNDRSGPLYLAIADALAADIEAGRLTAGERLPSQRGLAEALKIDFTTVGRAFAEARRRGLIDAAPGRGSFVRGLPPVATTGSKSSIDMTMNLPPQPAGAALRSRVESGLKTVLARPDFFALLTYRDAAGAVADREAGARWLKPRLGALAPATVLIASGAQVAMLAALSSLATAGDVVLTEGLTYPGLRSLSAQLGLRLQGVAMDAEGLLPEALEKACETYQAKALYCTPSLHNPTTATMSAQRRRDIAAVAKRYKLPIVEDDTYGLLLREAPPPLAHFAPDLTVYIGTLAKVLTPMLRVAYVVVPEATLAARLTTALRATTGMAPPLMVALATQWIENGMADDILLALRQEAMARQRIAKTLLQDNPYQTQPESHHLWLDLPPDWPRLDFVAQMQSQGLAIVPSDAFAVTTPAPEAVRLCLGAAADQHVLHQGLAILADTLRHREKIALAAIV
ncbi:MAG: PLP-dependent aminotransferase family protein [Dongiaceae bacterium]